ncbi:hypothetical protein LDO32_16725 [Luteimonas sp. Y-2-2-4F]|nr:hypothetical protein [Luteimonas sp. Y-2-2-4F]MCD9033361.1 hypothetical protein [Luteimonas sp. Y-2-2-4F]
MRSERLFLCTLAAAALCAAAPSRAGDASACDPLLPLLQAAYPGLSALPSSASHPENARYRVDAERVLDLAPQGPSAFNAHVAVCKPWPARAGLLLVAVPLLHADGEREDAHRADVDLLVVDAASGQPRQRLRLPEAASDDAMMLRSIVLDTARYDLAPDNRAFGLRLTRENNSRANPASVTVLYLIDRPHGDTGPLRRVLDNLVVNAEGGEWDTDCAGEFHSSASTLSMAAGITNGLHDIVLRSTSETRRNGIERGECVEQATDKGVNRETLRFDGRQYPVPLTLHATAEG